MRKMNRRGFLKTAGAVACVAGFDGSRGQRRGMHSATYEMVAATDRNRILTAAERYVSREPVTITAFPAKRSAGGLHDFYSQADYFWPNPKNPNGPYINRDGQSNPGNFDDHRKAMIALSVEMPALTAAWLLTADAKYGKRANDHLRAWFVTPATRMNPNLQYAQAVQNLVSGRSYGIIDTLHLVEVARAASLLTPSVQSAHDEAGVKEWFRSYLDWLKTSERGKEERDTLNNHAMCWALQAAEMRQGHSTLSRRRRMFRRVSASHTRLTARR
jgi:hypothetical protein